MFHINDVELIDGLIPTLQLSFCHLVVKLVVLYEIDSGALLWTSVVAFIT